MGLVTIFLSNENKITHDKYVFSTEWDHTKMTGICEQLW